MKVFKFGGASVSNADGVKNITTIIKSQNNSHLVIVISAMGKMTNAFEVLVNAYTKNQTIDEALQNIKHFHQNITDDLFDKTHQVYKDLEAYYTSITSFFNSNTNQDYNYIYDQIVGYGELISTTIISHYFNDNGLLHTWLNAHHLIRTDEQFRSANVDWNETKQQIEQHLSKQGIYLTQGFISGTKTGKFTTLGREGSDYSAAIIAYLLNAESLSIWKDVPGVLNADPRHFSDTQLLENISYREALEMAFYGATIIHPKTIRPLENKRIPLFVKSFLNPDKRGSIIAQDIDIQTKIACYTFKDNQILLSITTKDFSFMIEQNISHIFELFTQYKIKVNLIQNTATSFTVCIEDFYQQFEALKTIMSKHYELKSQPNVKLITLRHAKDTEVKNFIAHKDVLLIQQNKYATQIVLK